MATKVDVQARYIRLTDRIKDHVEKKAGKLDHYLPAIEEVRVELTHLKSARDANDRNVAQVTVRGKGLILRTEERADEVLAAFDTAIDNLHRQIDHYKGKHYRGRGDGRSASDVIEEPAVLDDTGDLPPLVARRKHFRILPMNELEAVEQMKLLGHDNFFVFFNADTNKVNVLYRRRDGSYGLIEPEIG
ncbi:MAG: ribosome-associated translation inhibitor RaiA [Chloroflexi bacterium]|nr:ribosome-associated translation inhibitor RaiA [Chloroflexota bacterium]MBI1854330.1 ribosome-associated translation inhibitor RaiA [Chloroflexota bacterium]MBI3341044.1 ribosome-associated translation inhibitor RaiA [Chloroflexota bacterium]